MIIKQLSVFLENKAGRLTELTKTLADNDINLSAFSIADTADYGIIRMVVGRPELAVNVLKEKGFAVKTTEVAGLIVPNEPGGLHKALQILSDENVSIEYMYAFALDNSASVVIRSDEMQRTIDVLQKHKMELISSNDIYQV